MPDNLILDIANHATGKKVVYIGEPATLDLTLANGSGTALTISDKAKFNVFFPNFYTPGDIAAMVPDLTGMPGWSYRVDNDSLVLTYAGKQECWYPNKPFVFSLDHVATASTTPSTDQSIQVNPEGIDELPVQVEFTLALIAAPQPGNLQLPLHFSLDYPGVVYVSDVTAPLANEITLYISNTSDEPLYSDTATPRPMAPRPEVVVSFNYGSTSGALLPSYNPDGSRSSAWDIIAAPDDLAGGSWASAGIGNDPSWTLSPSDNINPGVLGTKDRSTVAFKFKNIISYLVPGLTQMVVHCRNFTKTATTRYDDAVFFLDIVKQPAPAARGLISFHSPKPISKICHQQAVTIPLRWTMTYVSRVVLLSSHPSSVPTIPEYSQIGEPPPPLRYDQKEISVKSVRGSTMVLIALQAFDAANRYINSLQITAYIQANWFTDPVDQQIYPVVEFRGRFWMARDWARKEGGTMDSCSPNAPGLLYNYDAAAAAVATNSDGWRLPTFADWRSIVSALCDPGFQPPDDWESLFPLYSSASPDDLTEAYAALVVGGKSGFNAIMCGCRANDGTMGFPSAGVYWSADEAATKHSDRQRLLIIESLSEKILSQPTDTTWFASVRFVRDAS